MPDCSRTPKHRVADCDACGLCSACANEECESHKGGGGANRAANNKRIKEERIKAAAKLPERDVSRAEGAAIHVSLNEAKLDQITPAIMLPPVGEISLFRHVAAALHIDLAVLVRERTERLLDISELADTELGKAVLATLKKIVIASVWLIAKGEDAASYLWNALTETMLNGPSPHMSAADSALATSADMFVRAKSPLRRRAAFAVLASSFRFVRAQGLKLATDEAIGRARNDSTFLETIPPRRSRQTAATAGDSDKSSDEDEEPLAADVAVPGIVLRSADEQVRDLAAWGKSRTRLLQAERDFALLMVGSELEPRRARSRIKATAVHSLAVWMERQGEGWKGGHQRTVEIGDIVCRGMPVINMGSTASGLWTTFKQSARVGELLSVGEPLFRDVYKALCRKITENHSLSYFYTDMLMAFSILGDISRRLLEIWNGNRLPEGQADLAKRVELLALASTGVTLAAFIANVASSYSFAKYEMRNHLEMDGAKCTGNAMHCCAFAVNATCAQVAHQIGSCAPCLNYAQLAGQLRQLANAVRNALMREMPIHSAEAAAARSTADQELTSMLDCVEPLGLMLQAFHTHVARGLWQVSKYKAITESLEFGTLLIVTDYKMKILPVNFNQNSEEWYGQKGNSLLGAYLRFRLAPGGALQSMYLDTAFVGRSQDADQVHVGLENMVAYMKEQFIFLNKLIIVSDNAATFSCKENMAYVFHRNAELWRCGMIVCTWFFFEAQWGKTTLDTHFSFLNIVLKRFARKVRAVKTAADVHAALVFEHGLARTFTFLLDDHSVGAKPAKPKALGSAFSGIRSTHQLNFRSTGVDMYTVSGGLSMTSVLAAKIPILDSAKVVRTAGPWQLSALAAAQAQAALALAQAGASHDDEEEDDGSIKITTPPSALNSDVVIAQSLRAFAQGHNAVASEPAVLFGTVFPEDVFDQSAQGFSVSPHNFYKRNWAAVQGRVQVPLSQAMKARIVQLYQDGVNSSHKWDPASVAEKLLSTMELSKDWLARLAASEKSVQRVFAATAQQNKKAAKATQQQQQQGAAAASAPAEDAGSDAEVLAEADE
jgi:hypothetical protein